MLRLHLKKEQKKELSQHENEFKKSKRIIENAREKIAKLQQTIGGEIFNCMDSIRDIDRLDPSKFHDDNFANEMRRKISNESESESETETDMPPLERIPKNEDSEVEITAVNKKRPASPQLFQPQQPASKRQKTNTPDNSDDVPDVPGNK